MPTWIGSTERSPVASRAWRVRGDFARSGTAGVVHGRRWGRTRDGDANRREAMMSVDDTGVVVPTDAGGRRSSSALGRAVVADSLRGVDAVGALGAEREANWRRGYLVHF